MKKIFSILLSSILIVNSLALPVSSAAQVASASATNEQTGSTSNNEATNNTDNTGSVTNNNDTTVANNSDADTISGQNDANNNTAPAAITTGESAGSVTTETTANINEVAPMPWTTWTGEGDWTTRNSQTGSASTNTATNNTSTNTDVANNNNASIYNSTSGSSITGSNSASDNTGNSSITTGNASFIFDGKNIVNINGTGIWTGEGDWTNGYNGSVASNNQTGSSSTNNAVNNTSSSTNTQNNNNLNLVNNLEALALSGGNRANDNTGYGTITTGDASLVASLLNLANTNITGTSQLGLLFQDIFGQSNDNVDLGNATYFNTADIGSTLFGFSTNNNQTGSQSANSAGNNLDNVFTVENNNNGNIVNELNLSAITGDNRATDNTGNSNIDTGNASVIANLINFLNTNVVTSNFIFGVINVFGQWGGNLVLPDYDSASNNSLYNALLGTNSQTGSGSSNQAENNLANDLNLNNTNDASVQNNLNMNAATGDNNSSYNTLGGSVNAGNSSVRGGANTIANQNIVSDQPWWLVLVNRAGEIIPQLVSPDGTITLFGHPTALNTNGSNTQTGSNSINDAQNSASNNIDINNQNNGSIVNNIVANALTGGNTSTDNTGSGSINTGNASLLVSALNFINANIMTPNLVISLVNVFGDWSGEILTHDEAIDSLSQNTIDTNSSLSTTGNVQTNPAIGAATNPVQPLSVTGSSSQVSSNLGSATGSTTNNDTTFENQTNDGAKVLSYFDTKDLSIVSANVNSFADEPVTNTFGATANSEESMLNKLMGNQAFIASILVLSLAVFIRRVILKNNLLPLIQRG